MDIEDQRVDYEILTQALEQARQGRLHILDKLVETTPYQLKMSKTMRQR